MREIQRRRKWCIVMEFSTIGRVESQVQLASEWEVECVQKFNKYREQALKYLRTAGSDGEDPTGVSTDPLTALRRNRLVYAAYATMGLNNPTFDWIRLGAFAAKQIGCVMHTAWSRRGNIPLIRDNNLEMVGLLGRGNQGVFLEIFPVYLWVEDEGKEAVVACASALTFLAPGVLEGVAAVGDGTDTNYTQTARAEQGRLQGYVFEDERGLWNDRLAQGINNTPLPEAATTSLFLGARCREGQEITPPRPGALHNYEHRMNWILGTVIPGFKKFAGTDAALRALSTTGNGDSIPGFVPAAVPGGPKIDNIPRPPGPVPA